MRNVRDESALSAARFMAALGAAPSEKKEAPTDSRRSPQRRTKVSRGGMRGVPMAPNGTKQRHLVARLLGGFELTLDGVAVDAARWQLRLPRLLLQRLLLQPGHQVRREVLLEVLWPCTAPDAATNRLHHTVHMLRKLLSSPNCAGSPLVQLRPGVIALRDSLAVDTDLQVFIKAVSAARAATAAERDAHLQSAVAAYGGDLLSGLTLDDWAMEQREHLRWDYFWALEQLAASRRAAGDDASAMALYEQLADAQPTNEAAHGALIDLFAAAGRTDRAVLQFSACERALLCELNVAPSPATTAALERVLAAQHAAPMAPQAVTPPVRRPCRTPIHAVPLLGRERELGVLHSLLGPSAKRQRLVTVYGSAGVGKTRLAQQAAAELAQDFSDGVVEVSLDDARCAEDMAALIADALGVEAGQAPAQTLSRLAAHLADVNMLLLLDRVEHLPDARDVIDLLLAAAPGVHVLVTSQRRLGNPAEHVVSLSGLVDAHAQSAAALFMRCAGLENAVHGAQHVADICHVLQGNPLAIAMAARLAALLSPRDVLSVLDRPLNVLQGSATTTDDSHRSLRDCVARTVSLLDADARTMLDIMAGLGGHLGEAEAEALLTRLWPLHRVRSGLASLTELQLVHRVPYPLGGWGRCGLVVSWLVEEHIGSSRVLDPHVEVVVAAYAHQHVQKARALCNGLRASAQDAAHSA
jgi:DNA-binding SARP family transcriptional activator